ncbi:SRPBCC family protein [Nocardiopsis coralliicola]
MLYRKSVWIDAAPEVVWAVLADVGGWAAWTPTVDSVLLPDGEGLRPGLAVELSQPGRGVVRYLVTEVAEGKSFAWRRTAPGTVEEAVHAVEPDGAGTAATLTFRVSGPLGRVAGLAAATTIRRMVDQEAEGLRTAAEGR